MEPTFAGDADRDGDVDIADLGALATFWQSPGGWAFGDFDYSGFIDVNDLGILATNWQAGVNTPGPSFADAAAALGLPNAAVPEPSSAALLFGALMLRRRARFGRSGRIAM
jgi:hypothetical protein